MENKKDILDHLKVNKIESPGPEYFSNLAKDVIISQKKETKIIPLYKKASFWISAAAASIIVVLVLNFKGNQSQENVLLALNDVSTESIHAYVEDNIEDFEEELIAEFVSEESIASEEILPIEMAEDVAVVVQEEIKLEEVQEEDILKYFEDEEIDLFDLMEDESFI